MKISLSRRALAGAMLAGLGLCAAALAQPSATSMQVSDAWAAAPPQGARVASVYFMVHNNGAQADRLLSVSSSAAARTEMHEMRVVNGVMSMAPLRYGVSVPAGGQFAFSSGGAHVMLSNLNAPLSAGGDVQLRLTFQHAGVIEVTAPVRAR